MGTQEETAPTPPSRVQVEAVQTVTPSRACGPRSPRRITTATPTASAAEEALQSHVRVVLFYSRAVEDGTGWNLAGRLKESLNAALSEHPVFAGRLRRGEDGLEVRFTDSGVRLVQARAGAAMAELMGGLDSDDYGLELAQLAYWSNVDPHCLQYSPLFFVQLTVFEGEGYSIGISSSLLLADPMLLGEFLSTWSLIHGKMLSDSSFSGTSIFNLGRFKTAAGQAKFVHVSPSPSKNTHCHCRYRTMVFRTAGGASTQGQISRLQLASRCVAEAAAAGEVGSVDDFFLFSCDSSSGDGDMRVERCSGGATDEVDQWDVAVDKVEAVDWVGRMGTDKVGFEEGLLPVRVSYQVESVSGKGLVVVMPTSRDGDGGRVPVAFSATVPAQ